MSARDVPGLIFIKQVGSLAAAAAITLVMDRQLGTYVGNDMASGSIDNLRGSTTFSLLELSFSIEAWVSRFNFVSS